MSAKKNIVYYKRKFILTVLFLGMLSRQFAQIAGGFDTITVLKNNATLKLPWAGGLNACIFSEIDLNNDSKNDLVAFDKVNTFSYGIFRCFINEGTSGQIKYSFSPKYNAQFPYVEQWACFHDYNNDGKADLFTYTLGGIKVYKNTSSTSLSFTLAKSILRSNVTPTSSANYNPIYSSPISLPGFSDTDNDGDLDIIVFNASGFQLEFHKNLSKELYNHSDSLVFELNESTWGDFSESNCSVALNQFRGAEQTLHAGSCLLPFDRDGDGDKDLLLGDIGCDQMVYLENAGTPTVAHIGDTTKLYPNYPQKASTQIIKLNSFPAAHNVDVNNDGKKDLLVSPNATGGENANSVWLYQNTGTATTSYFQFTKNNFLQDEMIELGEGAYPVAVDVDADGLKDLVVGNLGYYQSGVLKTKLSLYKNVGTLSQPSYSFISNDYASISSFATTNTLVGLVPAFGDLDGDGDKDILLADLYGKLHYVENTGGAGNPFNLTVYTANAFGITTPQPAPYPQLIDVDRDNLLDLIIGLRNGKLAYYKNVGSTSSPSFSLMTSAFGNVNVKGPASLYSVDGSCSPFMYDEGGNYKLLCGSISGHIYLYDHIDGNLSGNFTLLDTMVNSINAGPRSALCYEDINNDGKRDLFVGNQAGGIQFYNSKMPVGLAEMQQNVTEDFSIFPNPAKNQVTLKLSQRSDSLFVYLYNSMAQLIYSSPVRDHLFSIQTEHLAAGIYFIRTGNADHLSAAKKIVIIK
jgi:hypothetical protein